MSSIATTNETSNVTSLPTAPKPQTSNEVIAANVKLLIEQLEDTAKGSPPTSPQWVNSITTASESELLDNGLDRFDRHKCISQNYCRRDRA